MAHTEYDDDNELDDAALEGLAGEVEEREAFERKPDTLYIENDDGEEIEIPSHYAVCHTCDGRGQHSLRFGAIAMSDFMGPDWDEDSRETYIKGGYDERCDTCKGRRVVLVADRDRCTPEQIKLIDEAAEFEAQCWAEEQNERRMLGCDR